MLGSIFKRLHNPITILTELKANSMRPFSLATVSLKEKDGSPKANEPKKSLIITEDQPPIPPHLGFPGNQDHVALFEIQKLNNTFQYGNPPRLIRERDRGKRVIRLATLSKCRNRRFYRIVLTRKNHDETDSFLEDLGSYDPMPNKENKILVALNIERIKYFLCQQVPVWGVASQLLGLAGLFPVHPSSYVKAFRNRKLLQQKKNEQEEEKTSEEEPKEKLATKQ